MGVPEDLIRKMAAEAIGTFILVLVGTGAILSSGNYAFAFGFAMIGIYFALSGISGAHANPAVTVGLAVVGRFPIMEVPYYVASQAVGAVLASLVLRLVHGNIFDLGSSTITEGYSLLDGFIFELVISAIFVFVFSAALTDRRVTPAIGGLAIGGTYVALELLAGPVTGASLNPFRSLAPAIVSGTFSDLWVYLIAPFIGAAIGAVAWEFIREPDEGALVQRPRSPQQRRQPAPVDGGDPSLRSAQQRRPAQRPAYERDVPPPTLYDDDLPAAQPLQQREQRAPQQQRPVYDQNAPQQRPPQRRRPPQQ